MALPLTARRLRRIIFISVGIGSAISGVLLFAMVTFAGWIRAQPEPSILLLGPSMWPTLLTFDVVSLGPPNNLARGDMASYRPANGGRLVHRIVGLPGETVIIRNGAIVLRSGDTESTLDEPYVGSARWSHQELTFELASEEYLLVGDNRLPLQGVDVVPKWAMHGVVSKIIFPPWRARYFVGS